MAFTQGADLIANNLSLRIILNLSFSDSELTVRRAFLGKVQP